LVPEHIDALHALLAQAYRNGFGEVPTTAEAWWKAISEDEEFEPPLVFVAVADDGKPVGVAQCWSSGFIKDIAVAEAWRGRGVGAALLQSVFAAFASRGVDSVDLKVRTENTGAIRLYRRAGMVAQP
jgi:ribosomal protein S18 acetylase RimI-like enzyme